MSKVDAYTKGVSIPTYDIGEADKNPMFLNRRVYQASCGKVYPYPFIEKISDEKKEKMYHCIFIENDFIQLMLMPELGGRIQYGYDKTHDYYFFYRNNVIKPALVGLTGPWISGGVEFNWPQHHRPSTFDPVEYHIEEQPCGAKTVWMGEIEAMSRMTGQVGITLYPDKSYVEVKGRSYNSTDFPQNFLWWANIAVHVHKEYESFFPQDVTYVADHGKREITSYPYADTIYYNIPYPKLSKEERNITNYSNIPVPMSYMAMNSDYDFLGGYDFKKEMGTLYVSNHHTAPGKKQWTWGCGDFGCAWDRQLTDEDGPYMELMAGAYTDNQPDFTWINPDETKEFSQYWYPFQKLGKVKNANLHAAVSLDYSNGVISYGIITPSVITDARYEIFYDNEILQQHTLTLTPKACITNSINKNLHDIFGLGIRIFDKYEKTLIEFVFRKKTISENAKPAIAVSSVNQAKTVEELYYMGLHLEQYRHALLEPKSYYEEGIRRDDGDVRCNTSLGMLLLKESDILQAKIHFEKAIERSTKYNPNPKDCECYYGLGLCYYYLNDWKNAYDMFYKSIWDYAYRSAGYFKLAQIDCIDKNFEKALEHVDASLLTNMKSTKARNLKAILLRKLGKKEYAQICIEETLKSNPLAYVSINEKEPQECHRTLREDKKNYIELALEYGACGCYQEALNALEHYVSMVKETYPIVYYLIGFYYKKIKNDEKCVQYYRKGEDALIDYCFPHRIEERIILESVINSIEAPKAHYYLGCLLYDKKQYKKAIEHFEHAAKSDTTNSVLYRNLGIAYFNVYKDSKKALEYYEQSFNINKKDGRILYELDQLYKILNHDIESRLNRLTKYFDLVKDRDDLYIEYITLNNNLGNYEYALRLLRTRNFHPFEGGEGKVSDQYKFSNIELARKNIELEEYRTALEYLEDAKVFPANLGEGKIYGTPEADIHYLMGIAHKHLKNEQASKKYFEFAANEKVETSSNLSYKPEKLQMNYYQGLALFELGKIQEANDVLLNLVEYSKAKSQIKSETDYFAISVPEFLIFEVDLDAINQSHCYYLMGLGYLGLEEYDNAKHALKKSLSINCNNYEANAVYRRVFSKSKNIST